MSDDQPLLTKCAVCDQSFQTDLDEDDPDADVCPACRSLFDAADEQLGDDEGNPFDGTDDAQETDPDGEDDDDEDRFFKHMAEQRAKS